VATKRVKAVAVEAVEPGEGWVVSSEPPPRISARRLPLDKLEHVRVEMAKVYRLMRSGELLAQQGTRLVYVLGEISKILSLCQIEQRLTVLESGAALLPPHEDDHGDES
jgi:hypothetical protein